jgi:uncharacterized protein (TIGR00297 family)
LIFLIQPGNSISISQFAFGLILSLLISAFSYKIKFLTASGSLAIFILAFVIFSLGGWKWTIPILFFYIFSTLLSKIRERKNPSVNEFFEKSGSRDLYQVLANGGPGGILVVINFIFPDTFWFLVYSGVVASSCADTWATEFGTMTKHRTYDILRFRSVEQGSSGGVSLTGFIGALCGALFISLISVLWVDNNIIDFILMVTVAGFAAALVDSILGASLQVQYQCTICGRIIDRREHCESKTARYRGIKFINNDLVNLCAGLSGGIIVYCLTCI